MSQKHYPSIVTVICTSSMLVVIVFNASITSRHRHLLFTPVCSVMRSSCFHRICESTEVPSSVVFRSSLQFVRCRSCKSPCSTLRSPVDTDTCFSSSLCSVIRSFVCIQFAKRSHPTVVDFHPATRARARYTPDAVTQRLALRSSKHTAIDQLTDVAVVL